MVTIKTKIQKRDARGDVRHGAEWLQLWANPDDDLTAFEQTTKKRSQLALERRKRSVEQLAVPLSGNPHFKPPALNPTQNWTAKDWAISRAQIAKAAFEARFPSGLVGLGAMLGQARSVALGLGQFPGLFDDLRVLVQHELDLAGCGHAFLAAQLPLERALFLVFVDRWFQLSTPFWDSGAVDMWATWLARKCPNSILALDRHLLDQEQFEQAVADFLEELASTLSSTATSDHPDDNQDGDQGNDNMVDGELSSDLDDALEPILLEAMELDKASSPLDHANAEDDSTVAVATLVPYTRDFDQEQPLTNALQQEVIAKHSARLSEKYLQQLTEARKLSRALAYALCAEQKSDWQFDQEEGLIDSSRLAQIVAAPERTRAFKAEISSFELDACVTLLIDCSGSMRGKWMDLSVIASQALGDALNLAGISFEVLGFTTAATNGGHAFQAWREAGAPTPEVGTAWRLNDLRHYVAKSFGQPWRKARTSVPGLCDASLLKENIDSEALVWAAKRASARLEKRHILIVMTDGMPSCSTSEKYCGPGPLYEATKAVASNLGRKEIYALGLRQDPSSLYDKSIEIKSENQISSALMDLAKFATIGPGKSA